MILRLDITNIGAYTKAVFVFGEGKNVVIGENGSGKTTLLKAIAFGMFGNTKLIGDLNLADFLREGEDEGTITIEFTDAHRRSRCELTRTITRSGDRASSTASLMVDGTSRITGVNAVNDEVEKLLGIDAKMWSETTWGKQGEISAILSGKKDVFDRMMGVEIYETTWKKMRVVEKNFERQRDSMKDTIIQLQSLTADRSAKIKLLKHTKKELETYKEQHALLGGDGSDTMIKFNYITDQITTMQSSASVYKSKIDEKQQLANDIMTLETCPTCLQPVSESHKKHIHEECGESIIIMDEHLNVITGKLESLVEEKKGLETALQHVQESGELKGRIESFETRVIPELENKIKEIDDATSRIASLQDRSNDANRLHDLASQVRTAFRGVQPSIRKARTRQIQRTTLDIFNELFGEEYDALDIDPNDFSMTIHKDGEERKVSVMSGGERVALGIAMRIAIAKEIGGQDLLILDEPMGQLDRPRKAQLIDLLENMTIDTQLVMVTHDDMLSGASDSLIKIKKTSNGSIPHVIDRN